MLQKRDSKIKINSSIVKQIIKNVREGGDKAIIKYEKKFSKNNEILPSKKKIYQSIKLLDPKIKKSIDFAFNRIFKFHLEQKVKNIFYKDKLNNKIYYKYFPIDSIGIYVPGGTASYPSSILMNSIPAKIAGVKKISMVMPQKNIELES